MSRASVFLSCCFTIVAAAVLFGAPEGGRGAIAVVNMDRLLERSPETARAEALLEKQSHEFALERDELLSGLQAMREDFEKAGREAMSSALSQKAREEREEIARQKLIQLREHEARVRDVLKRRSDEISDQAMRMRRRTVESLKALVRQYAEKEGFSLVLDSSGLGVSAVDLVVYHQDALDITESVLKLIKTDDAAKEKAQE